MIETSMVIFIMGILLCGTLLQVGDDTVKSIEELKPKKPEKEPPLELTDRIVFYLRELAKKELTPLPDNPEAAYAAGINDGATILADLIVNEFKEPNA